MLTVTLVKTFFCTFVLMFVEFFCVQKAKTDKQGISVRLKENFFLSKAISQQTRKIRQSFNDISDMFA